MSESEYENLPIGELLEHKVWKARQLGYSQLKEIAEKSVSDELITQLVSNPQRLLKIVTDSNVAAQETGLCALTMILKQSSPETASRSRDILVPALVEKGLTSSKASSRSEAIEALLLYAELDSCKEVVELMVPGLSAKSPKQVTATVKAINDIYSAFGCPTIDPKLIINSIPKLFEHSDKNVRAEASGLSVTIRSFIGDSFDLTVFPKIKPIQQKDLKALFDKIEPGVKPSRMTYSQKSAGLVENDEDIQMTEELVIESRDEATAAFNAYDFEDPVDVLSQLPTDLSTRLRESVWKERVEVLEEIAGYFKAPKIQDEDYSYFISLMVGCLRDVNLQVVTLACGILLDLANGLKSHFHKYSSTLISPLLERTKERKKTVLGALIEVLDTCFKYSSFRDIVDPTLEYMVHISPHVKVESMQFLVRCLKETKVLPTGDEVERIMASAIKLLQDSQVTVRNAASEVIGTLMKLIGPEKSRKYLDKVDKRHVKKVQQICQSAAVKLGTTRGEFFAIEKVTSSNDRIPDLGQPGVGSDISESEKKTATVPCASRSSSSSIPAKRAATSPLKENVANHKNTLTSKPLKASNMSNYGMSAQQLQELEMLKAEKLEWLEEKKVLLSDLEEVKSNNDSLLKNVVSLNGKLDDYHEKFTTMSMTLKSKDTQIFRLRSDLENCQIRYSQLQQKNKALNGQLELSSNKNTAPGNSNKVNEDSNDINRRISILSIGSSTAEAKEAEKTPVLHNNVSIYNFDDADDGWKRATAVTNDLKAKIQRMKARTRVLDPVDD
ncbi:hypothetical protein PMKS-003267 [Pichia membranifaciens]|uniref:TOG domain-containing protein n=1 Tax=Pichia membranifaciens TaxID=4926 RepID=A0A1Q2YJR6_9ASCO|nr:hypothetical protein PMKS-003267 [Pichia membranifaciens]